MIEMEQSALGAMLINIEDTVEDAINVLGETGEVFADERHQWIYAAIMGLYQSGDPVDLVTVCHALVEMNRLADCGGAVYVASLLDVVPTSYNFRYYARVVKAMRLKRDLLDACTKTGGGLNSGRIDNEEALRQLEGVVMNSLARTTNGKIESVGEILPRVLAGIRESADTNNRRTGTPTGLHKIDGVMGGFRPETLNVLAARPSVGKSALAVNFALAAARADHPVLFFSLEMGRESVVRRFVSVATAKAWSTIERNAILASQTRAIEHTFEELRKTKIYIMDNEKLDAFRLRANARRFASAHFPRRPIIIIDYLQLCVRGGNNASRRHEMIGDFTRECKALSRELQCPFVLLSQLSREADSSDNPFNCMHCLKDSGNIEEDADTVMIITKHCSKDEYAYAQRQGVEPKNLLNFGLVKNREGATCGELLFFDKETQQIECLEDRGKSPSVYAEPEPEPEQYDIENSYEESDELF